MLKYVFYDDEKEMTVDPYWEEDTMKIIIEDPDPDSQNWCQIKLRSNDVRQLVEVLQNALKGENNNGVS